MAVFKKISGIVSTVILVIALLFVALFFGGRLFGYRPYVVLSGSMEPTYPTGSLLIVQDAVASDVAAGDPITFRLDDSTVATHRVVRIDTEEEQFVTKGDNNDFEDTPISFDKLVGKPVYSVAGLGYAIGWVTQPTGKYIALAVLALCSLLLLLPELLGADKTEKRKPAH